MIRPQPRRLIAFVKGVRPDRVSTFSERGTRSLAFATRRPLPLPLSLPPFFFVLFRSQTQLAPRFPPDLSLPAGTRCNLREPAQRRENFLKRCCESFGSNERKAAAKWRDGRRRTGGGLPYEGMTRAVGSLKCAAQAPIPKYLYRNWHFRTRNARTSSRNGRSLNIYRERTRVMYPMSIIRNVNEAVIFNAPREISSIQYPP